MARNTVPFQMAADALSQVLLSFPRVVASGLGHPAPNLFWRMDAAPSNGILVGAADGQAGPFVTGDAEGLLSVAARAPWTVDSSGPRMRAEPIAGMHVAMTHAAIVAFGAISLSMTARAKGAVVASNVGMTPPEIAAVPCSTEFRSRQEAAHREIGDQTPAPRQMAYRALASRITTGSSRQSVAA